MIALSPAMAAVILAAGHSRRMGRPKLALPWGRTTVIGQVVASLVTAGVGDIVIVTGGGRAAVEAALSGAPARIVYNPRHDEDHMLLSLQTGLRALADDCPAALVALGDQPQIESAVVSAVIAAWQNCHAGLVIPSHRMRRGHPWLVARALWDDLFNLQPPATLRDFHNRNGAAIHYLPVETASVLADLDTPEAYAASRPVDTG